MSLLTIDDLYKFFVEQNKNVSFSAKDKTPIVVSVPGIFAKEDDAMPGLLKLKLKVCHTELNRNGSFISKENMEKGMPTLKYRPILAHIHELEDGTKDFYAHNMEIVENEDGESEINYIEKQVGCFTADDPWLEYDKDMDKTYVMAYSVIPEQYTEAADIIRRKNGSKVSCELVINELSYNAKEKYLDLTDFYFSGCTLLGCDEEGNEIGEGMLGARADITDFCHKEPVFTYHDKLIETLEKLNVTLEGFNKNTTQKGGDKMKFEELLAKYGITAEEVTFEIEGLSDEELEAKFAEAFDCDGDDGNDSGSTDTDDGDGDSADGDDSGEDDNDDGDGDGDNDGDSEPEKFTKIFTVELSHEDVHCALYNLIAQYDEEDNEYYYIRNVYDNYFIMHGWRNNKLYKVYYTVDGENVSLEGERQEVFELIVTESEKIAIEKMRENYDSLVKYKEDTEAAALQAKKDTIFADEKYAKVVNTNAFKKLVENSKDYSVEECAQKADEILDDFSSFAVNFAATDEVKKTGTLGLNFNAKPSKKKSAYGGLFEKDE
jgi:hypothetical protein